MKKLVYLLFLFLFVGGSFTYKNNFNKQIYNGQELSIDVLMEQPHTSTSHDGSIRISIIGGTAPYTVQVVSTFSPSKIYQTESIELSKLGIGNYTFIVQDAKKKIAQKTVELTSVQ